MTYRIITGDALERLRELPDESVHCVVTSPPYWGLRDYGVPEQIGLEATPDEWCARLVEVFREVRRVLRHDGVFFLNIGDSYAGSWGNQGRKEERGQQRPINGDMLQPVHDGRYPAKESNTGAIPEGADLKPKDLVGQPWLLAFALRADGWYLRADCIWHKPNPMPESVRDRPTKSHEYVFVFTKGHWKSRVVQFSDLSGEKCHFGQNLGLQNMSFKPVSVCVALATAIFDGAQRQNDFCLPPFYAEEWKKGSDGNGSSFVAGLPIEHRATAAAARFLCADASAEEFLGELDRLRIALADANKLLVGDVVTEIGLSPVASPDREGAIAVHHAGKIGKIDFAHRRIILEYPSSATYFWDAEAVRGGVTGNAHARRSDGERRLRDGEQGTFNGRPGSWEDDYLPAARNLRSVWTLATEPYGEAHFATFPTALARRCILAGTSGKGVCPDCGAPWVRVVEREPGTVEGNLRPKAVGHAGYGSISSTLSLSGNGSKEWAERGSRTTTTGWRPSCACDAGEPIPATVLDPFAGAATTLLAAEQLGRNSIGIELSPAYAEMGERRIERWRSERAVGRDAPRHAPLPGQQSLFADGEP